MKCSVAKGIIHYEMTGKGFPLIILHSMGTDHRSMQAWLEAMFQNTDEYQRIYLDLPAHGYSLINEDFTSSEDMLMNVLEFIDQTIPNQEFSLVGFSYGGYIAQGILHHRRNLVKSICLLAPALHLTERSKLPEKVVQEQDTEALKELDSDIRTAVETLLNVQNKENIEIFLSEIQPGRLLANRDFLLSNWRENGYFFSEAPLHNVKEVPHPALFILGRQDSICGYKDHLPLLDKFPYGTLAILDQTGHMLHIEKRDVVKSLIKDWLNRTDTINTKFTITK